MNRCLVALLTLAALSLFAEPAQRDYKKEMDQVYRDARELQQEKKFQDAFDLLAKYDNETAAPLNLRLQFQDYKTWLCTAMKDYDTAGRESLRLLDLGVPQGYTKAIDLAYGPHARQQLDLYYHADAKTPSPVLVMIHGGGWLHGDRKVEAISRRGDARAVLAAGGAVATISYRLSSDAPLPAPVRDAALAIQFLRANADKYHLDKTRFVAIGGSAGGCTTAWLATHDDLADPDAEDPVLRESTRLCGGVIEGGQTTLDPADMKAWNNEGALQHAMFHRALGCTTNDQMYANIEQVQPLIDEYSAVKHLSADDPPTVLRYTGPLSRPGEVHHPYFGIGFKAAADKVGAPCKLSIRGEQDYPEPEPGFLLELLGLKQD